MTKSRHRTLLLVAGLASVLAVRSVAEHIPISGGSTPFSQPEFEVQGHARVFFGEGDLTGMAEYLARIDTDRADVPVNAFTVGGYYRVHQNVKIGAFYRLQAGTRHDDDWVVDESGWRWRDSSRRLEHVGIFDITPRFLVPKLPGKDWVLSLKNRFEFAVYSQSGEYKTPVSLLVRPGITRFIVRDREPIANIAVHYTTYWALNYGEQSLYSHGPYVNGLYHVGPHLKMDLGLGLRFDHWSESSAFAASRPNEDYPEGSYSPWFVDVGIVYVVDP